MTYQNITAIVKDWGVIIFMSASMYFTVNQLKDTVIELKTTVETLNDIVTDSKLETAKILENHEVRIQNNTEDINTYFENGK